MKIVGLTGGIGSGKSTAARLLAQLGALVLDADRVGHEVYEPGSPGWQQVAAAFGQGVVAEDGRIDRKRLGSIVFSDPEELRRLNAIVHPLIRAALTSRVADIRRRSRPTAVVIEAAVLLEAGWDAMVDEIWLVVADRTSVVERIVLQRGLDATSVHARIAAQMSDEERRHKADVVIDNSGDFESLRDQVTSLWNQRLVAP